MTARAAPSTVLPQQRLHAERRRGWKCKTKQQRVVDGEGCWYCLALVAACHCRLVVQALPGQGCMRNGRRSGKRKTVRKCWCLAPVAVRHHHRCTSAACARLQSSSEQSATGSVAVHERRMPPVCSAISRKQQFVRKVEGSRWEIVARLEQEGTCTLATHQVLAMTGTAHM